MFAEEAERLRARLGAVALSIDHNGSTSVPGLAAKPVIDMQISVAEMQPMDLYREPLRRLGYVHVPDADDCFCPFFHRPESWPHTHHIHVVQAGGAEEHRTLAFRDHLRRHAEVARRYEALKRELVAVERRDREAREDYARAKTDFVEQTIAAADAGQLVVTLGDPRKPEAMGLVAALSAELRRRYGGGDGDFTDFHPDEFLARRSGFLVGRRDGRAIACGAFCGLEGDVCEIKRMYVADGERRRGHARRVLAAVERLARGHGYTAARLQTGDDQSEAMGLYENAGYRRIARFGAYVDNQRGVCFEKALV